MNFTPLPTTTATTNQQTLTK